MAMRSNMRINLGSCLTSWFPRFATAWIRQAEGGFSPSAPTSPGSMGPDYLRLSIGATSQSEERFSKKARHSQAASYTGEPSSSLAPLELFPTSSQNFREHSTPESNRLPPGDTAYSNPLRSLPDFPNLDLSLGPNDSFHGSNEAIEVDRSASSQTDGLSQKTLGPASAITDSPQLDAFAHSGSKHLENKMLEDSASRQAIFEYMRPFESLLELILALPTSNKGLHDRESGSHISTAAVISPDHQVRRINRILDSHGRYLFPSQLHKSFLNLIKHIVFFHALLPIRFFRATGTPILDLKSIIHWLYKEFFDPQKAFPILGLVRQNPPLNNPYEFSTNEKKLITYFRAGDSSADLDLITLAIIESCYVSTHPKEWRRLLHYMSSHGRSFDGEMLGLQANMTDRRLEQLLQSEQVPSHPPDGPRHAIEDFRWPYLVDRQAQNGYLVDSSLTRFKGDYAEVAKRTVAFRVKFSAKMIISPRNHRARTNRISGVPAVSFGASKGEVMIKPMNHWGGVLRNGNIQSNMSLLIARVVLHHVALMEHLKPNPHSNPPLLQGFFTWVDETIFESNQDTLPVYGIVKERPEPFTSKDFGAAQTYLLHFFNRPLTRSNPVDDLTLLGYWYKKFHPQFWNIYCGNEVGFQELIAYSTLKFDQRKQIERKNKKIGGSESKANF